MNSAVAIFLLTIETISYPYRPNVRQAYTPWRNTMEIQGTHKDCVMAGLRIAAEKVNRQDPGRDLWETKDVSIKCEEIGVPYSIKKMRMQGRID